MQREAEKDGKLALFHLSHRHSSFRSVGSAWRNNFKFRVVSGRIGPVLKRFRLGPIGQGLSKASEA